MTTTVVKYLAVKLFKRFKFMAGWTDNFLSMPTIKAWHIPSKQVVDDSRYVPEEWFIYCPYKKDGSYEPLINLVERKIAANLDFYMATSSEKAH